MGKASAFLIDDLLNGVQNGVLKSKGCETATTIRDRTYVISGGDDALALEVQIFDKAANKRIIPTVLGTKPMPGKGHSAIQLDENKILILKKGSTSDDCIWFLEVDSTYVREQKKKLDTEVVAWSKGMEGNADMQIVISGPSGVGKGTLISMLKDEFPSMFGFSVSHTTRAPRIGEEDGVHYHFTDKNVMEQEIKDGKFLEFASVHGNLYGTSIEAVEVVADAGKRCILDIDVQGARSVRASALDAIFIFICPPSMEELEKRLRARGTDAEEQVLKRLRNAKTEIQQGEKSDIFDHILYNDKLEDCYKKLKELLGLKGNVTTKQKSASHGIDLPVDHSVSKINDKIVITCGTPEHGNESKNFRIVLNVSALKGGAPGRTRGIEVYDVISFSDGLNGMKLPN
ncbi:hypothetical protein K2173_019808 [Erythroxylum novogranatense]|uniref:Guanylate kinase 1 n=1 Tax=Erythroxylum novogranatense TaxID=1862640 RepID=A0AAV8SN45_9ROSI|nr:hypothetical protein K2173_019808 [Erythroxylum novogranatense]